jgi:hypothetical protein
LELSKPSEILELPELPELPEPEPPKTPVALEMPVYPEYFKNSFYLKSFL